MIEDGELDDGIKESACYEQYLYEIYNVRVRIEGGWRGREHAIGV